MTHSDKIELPFSIKLATGAVTSVAALAFSIVSLQVAAVGSDEASQLPPLAVTFGNLDRDADGLLSPEEAKQDDDITQNFVLADLDRDGMLSMDEYASFKSAAQQERIDSYLDDATVTAKVKAELVKDSGMKSLDISVETHKGQVILSGFVDNGEQLLRAVHIASGVSGVQSVKNALVIRS